MAVPATYPDIGVGDLVTADLLTSMLPAAVVKSALTSRTSTTTLAADGDLTGITLGVGTWKIELLLFWSCSVSATQKIKTQWGFTGTWNNPTRGCVGPGNVTTGTPRDAVQEMNVSANATNVDAVYNVQNNALFTTVREMTYLAVVTSPGDLSLQWAQSVSSANPTIVQPGSAFEVRRIA